MEANELNHRSDSLNHKYPPVLGVKSSGRVVLYTRFDWELVVVSMAVITLPKVFRRLSTYTTEVKRAGMI